MPLDYTALKEQVTRNRTIDGSAKTLITGLLAAVEENKNDPAELQAIVDEFRADNDEFGEMITANTPTPSS